MGDLFPQYSTFVECLWLPSFSYRSTKHPVGDACLLSLAIAGIPSEGVKSRTRFIFTIWDGGGSDAIRSSKIIVMTPYNCGLFGQKVGCDKPQNGPHPPDHWGMQIRLKIGLKIFKCVANLRETSKMRTDRVPPATGLGNTALK